MRLLIFTALLVGAAPVAGQFPSADQRMQRLTEQYQTDLANCERRYQAATRAIADRSRYNIPAAGALAVQDYQRCRQWAQRRFEYGGRLQHTAPSR